MAYVKINDEHLTNYANSIRQAKNNNKHYTPEQLEDEIQGLAEKTIEQETTITRQNTTIDELNERRIPVYIEPQLVPKEVIPQLTNQYIEPPQGKNGFNAISVNPITSDLVPNCEPQNIAKGKTILGVTGTFDSFPENPVGGIYFYEPDENDNPTKCKIYNFNFTPSIEFPDWFFRNNKMPHIKEVVFDSSNFYGIAQGAFLNSPTISKVVLPNSIISIGARAFLQSGLSSINIPNSLVSMGSQCFEQCHELTGKFVFSSNLQEIRNNAFYETEIQEVTIPSADIGSLAFYSCRALYKVFLGNAINGIHNRAFEGCTNLIDVTIEGGFNANGLNLSSSTRFTAETIVSWLEALTDRTGDTAYTLTMGTTNLNKLTNEQKAIAINKNWNLA